MDGPENLTTTKGQGFLKNWLGPLVVAAAFLLAAGLSWRKWTDPLIDFGLQLYLPWKISSGHLLYHDVMYLTGGPLSQHFNGLLFGIFGASVTTLMFVNLILIAALLTLVYRRFRAASDALTATLICVVVIFGFAFAQFDDIGNYNYVTPYCHEVLHGLVLSVLAIVLMSNWLEKQRHAYVVGAGFCAGLVVLTKPEICAALAVCLIAAFVIRLVDGRQVKGKQAAPRDANRVPLVLGLTLFGVAALMPLVGFLLWFHRVESWTESWRSVFFAWWPLLRTSVGQGFYYRWCMGFDNPWHHLGLMLLQFSVLSGVVGLYAWAFRKTILNRVVLILLVAPLAALASRFDWTDCGRSLPVLSLTCCGLVMTARQPFRGSRRREEAKSSPVPGSGSNWDIGGASAFPLLWSVFSVALLAKLGLFARIWHYGFVLAMPAFVTAVYFLTWLLPVLLERRFGVQRRPFRGIICLVLAVGFAFLFAQSQIHYGRRTVAVGQGRDRFFAPGHETDPAGEAVQQAVAWLTTNLPPAATLAVLPEGVMVNYLSRRSNPTHYFVWNPAELAVFGQKEMTETFETNAPDYVMLVDRDAAEYGVKPFGQEERFGLELMRWIQQHYEPVWLIGHEPLEGVGFGIKLLRKKAV